MAFESEFDVATASTYKEAKRKLISHRPAFDVAIIDIRLEDEDPDNEDGLRLLRDIQEYSPKTKSIILTGYPSIQNVKAAIKEFEAFDYLEKYPPGGLDVKNLRQTVYRAIGEKRVLLVEDDPEWQQVLADVLVDGGYVVDRVASSEEARKRFEDYKYPIAVVDLRLGSETPEQGLDLLEYVHRTAPGSDLVVVSGYSNTERVIDAFERGRAKGFLPKDEFDSKSLLEKVSGVSR
jgi:DNA-binding NtrC family response regulator